MSLGQEVFGHLLCYLPPELTGSALEGLGALDMRRVEDVFLGLSKISLLVQRVQRFLIVRFYGQGRGCVTGHLVQQLIDDAVLQLGVDLSHSHVELDPVRKVVEHDF